MPVNSSLQDASAPRTLAAANLPRRVRGVLEKARALVASDLDRSLRMLLEEFERELFRLADVARNPGSESGYMQTLRTFRMNRADVIPHLLLELEASVAGIRHVKTTPVQAEALKRSFQSLSLVEEATVDEDVVLRDIAMRQEGKSNLALHLLSQRFGVLAGSPAPDAARMPLGPQALCNAIHRASLALEIDYDARLLLYRLFDRHVMSGYGRILESLDAAMVKEGILTGLSYVPVRTRPSAQGNGAEPDNFEATAGTQPGADGGPARQRAYSHQPSGHGHGQRGYSQGDGPSQGQGHSQGHGPGQGPGHNRDQGQQTHAGQGRNGGAQHAPLDPHRPHTSWPGELDESEDMDAGSSDAEAAYDSLRQLMSGRRELIGKLQPSRARNNSPPLATLDVDKALSALQSQPMSQAGSTQTLSDIKQTLLAQVRQQRGHGARLSQTDEDSFELLNMLYSQIDVEINAEAPAAGLLKRLQLPLLRVALQDGGFFVRVNHPARQLLNTVAEGSAKWLDKDDFDPQLLTPMKQAVDYVLQNFDGNENVFKESNDKLQETLHATVRKAELLERRHVEAARGKEKLEVAKLRAASTLTELLGEQRIPKFTHALLNQAWSDVLTLTLLRHGEDTEQWQKQLDATRQIIESCARTGHGGEKADPELSTHVESALSQVGYQGEEASVIAQRLTGSLSEGEDDPASRTELAMKVKARARLGEDSTREKAPKQPPRTPEEQQRYEQLRIMPFGVWIEFNTNQQGDVVRRRLSWYSPVTDNALFVNQRGQRIGEQTLDSLARMLANGQARIVTAERGRLVDRAWQAAVKALRSFASRGDATPDLDVDAGGAPA